jgi:beta-glucanase (GH16 family)
MQFLNCMIVMLGVILGAPTQASDSRLPDLPRGHQWSLAWSDEFNGTELDPSKWNFFGDSASEGPRLISVHGGVLQFHVANEKGKLKAALISTGGHFQSAYGYWEMRAKLPSTPGYRPAFWLSTRNINLVNSPTHPTEIDILEYPARSGTARVNLHWNGYARFHQTTGSSWPLSSPTQFHVYGVWWRPDGYYFYIDGELAWTSKGGGISSEPEFIKLGDTLFDKTPRNLPSSFSPNDDFTVDWVRVYREQ